MTSNQLAYWQNVERERSNRAQEAIAKMTIPSQINENLASAQNLLASAETQKTQAMLNLANELLTQTKTGLTQQEAEKAYLDKLITQYELGRQKYIDTQVALDTELQMAEQQGKLFDARVSGNRDTPAAAETLAAATNIGDILGNLFSFFKFGIGGK